MPGIPTRLERLERATAEIRCVWLYVGWSGRPGIEGAGDGVYRVFVPTLPPALPPGQQTPQPRPRRGHPTPIGPIPRLG